MIIVWSSSDSASGTRIHQPRKPPIPVFRKKQAANQGSTTGTEKPQRSVQPDDNFARSTSPGCFASNLHDGKIGSLKTTDEDVHFLEIPMHEQNEDLLTCVNLDYILIGRGGSPKTDDGEVHESAEDSPQNAAAACPLPVSAESPSSEDESLEQSRVLVPHVSTTPPSLSLKVKITKMKIPRIPKHKEGGVVVEDYKQHIFSLLDFFLELSFEVDPAGKLPIHFLFHHVQKAIISKFLNGKWAKHLDQQNHHAFAWHLKNQKPNRQFCLSFSEEQPGVPFNPKPLQNLGISLRQSDLIENTLIEKDGFPGICVEFTVSI